MCSETRTIKLAETRGKIMKWITVKDKLPDNCRRVLVCLAYPVLGAHSAYLMEEPNGKAYHYWVSVGKYCCSDGWKYDGGKIEVHRTMDRVVYWSELPNLPEALCEMG